MSHHDPLTLRAALFLVLLSSHAALAQTVVVPTFSLGAAGPGRHIQDIDVAPAPDGGFIVIWGEYALSGNRAAARAMTRRFTAQGSPLGPSFRADTSGHVFGPVISPGPTGGYFAAWPWVGGGQYLFFGQVLDAAGVPTGVDFESTLNLPGWPITSGTVVGLADGPVFIWPENGLWARSLDSNRDRRGGETRVGAGGYRLDVAVTRDGGFVVVWAGGSGEAATMGRVFGPDAQPRGDAFAVSDRFGAARVAASPFDGAIAAVGACERGDGSTYDACGRRFAPDGLPLADEFVVSASSSGSVAYPDVEFDDLGNLYVPWIEYGQTTGALQRPRARAYDVLGDPIGPPVEINDRESGGVRATRLTSGAIVNVWVRFGSPEANVVRLCTAGASSCGDGLRVAACEQCDDGPANSDTAPDACRSDCRFPRCGDGVTDAGEECDDGNAESCDGCSSSCALEPGATCGDGVRDRACGEECDQGLANSDAAPNACRTDCTLSRCGDGAVDAGEECDDGNAKSCDGCSFDCRREADLPDGDGNGVPDQCDSCRDFGPVCAPQPLDGLPNAARARFEVGVGEFLEIENSATGLGPVFNGTRCAECHNQPTTGGAGERLVTRIGTTGIGGFDPLPAHGGPLLQERGIATGTCSVPGEVVPAEATIVARRSTPALFGIGLLEAIPELSLRLLEDTTDRNRDGISGRLGSAAGHVGRFGWKAQVARLHDFAAEAYLDEMGITSPFLTRENLPQGEPLMCDPAPDPEDDGDDVAAFTDFMSLLAPPPPGPITKEARRGRAAFRRARCHLCHTTKYRTADNFPIGALKNRRVLAYTDLLLHDMGPALADQVRQGSATGSEFRTPPLWGIRFSAPYLHDGRAPTLEEAILGHGGEAQASRDRFLGLTLPKRAALIAFLGSL